MSDNVCSCVIGNPLNYEGPSKDCLLHGEHVQPDEARDAYLLAMNEPVQPDIEALTDELIYGAGCYYRKYPASDGSSFDPGPQTGLSGMT